MVQVSRLPRSIEFFPIRYMLKRKFSRLREAMSRMARFAVTEYSIDCRKCHSCGSIGYGRSARGRTSRGTYGIRIGVGLPMVSVRMPIMLWKYAVVLKPPFHQVEYNLPER